ncbi:MAG: T9SS type A sorting domain-containing protein, partial [Bacteroidetes bacterium]|nr:T9SS type A sorting domain-containing protein [Bacteroidota bacterium]
VADMNNDGVMDIVTENNIYNKNGSSFYSRGFGSNFAIPVDVDGNGTVWISSQSWIHFKTSAASSFSMKDSSDGITHLSCRSIMADNDNNIYVATDSGFTILNDAGIVFCIDFTSVDVACKGDTTGSITADPRFGIAPYLYTWNNGNTTDNLTGLTAGIYSVNITDTNTFAASGSVTITEPDSALMITDTGHVNSSEFEANDGKAWITAVGGTSPRTITWFGSSQTGDTIINIGPGIYVATVVDANGCTEISDSLFVTEPPFVPGIDDADIQFNIYPNPSSGEVYIKTDRKARVEIIGLDGRVIKTRQLYPGIMQALQLDQGIYLARIVSNSGMKVQKLVVH